MRPIVTYMFRGMCVVNACVCLLDSTLSCATAAEPIEIPFRTWTRVGPRNHELCGGPDPQGKGQFFLGGGISQPIVSIRRVVSTILGRWQHAAICRCQYFSNLFNV